jgi:hypothetical protein
MNIGMKWRKKQLKVAIAFSERRELLNKVKVVGVLTGRKGDY